MHDKIESPVNQFRDDVRRRAEALAEGPRAVRDFIDTTQRSLDEMQHVIDNRLRDSVDQLTHIPEMRREMISLENRIIALEQSVHRIERTLQEIVPGKPATSTDPHCNIP